MIARPLLAALLFVSPSLALSTGPEITDKPGGFPLVTADAAAPIFVADEDHRVVSISANALARDLALVSGKKPEVLTGPPRGKNVVVIGTLGRNHFLDDLVKAGRLDVRAITGKWEATLITTIDRPTPGVGRALVIAGSDRRGTSYGAFALSEACGVSPWVWWADVSPRRRAALFVKTNATVQGPPAVKYRGIFLNDEDWGLQPWAAKTFDPGTKDIGPRTYARIFELLLRLRANAIWPAMHPCTRAFNAFPENKQVADDYAIVMGSSHPEPLLRNNVGEWKSATMGPWDYFKNQAAIDRYWEERVVENARFENLWTIGMRGEHDSGMEGGHSVAENVAKLEEVFENQRQMLARHVNPDITKVPQAFIPYKEVLGLYRAGLKVPDDATLVWVDDNHGYVRQLSTPAEQKRSGGAGVYYHISYWGRPADYLWLGTTSPALIWEEMTKAYDQNARRFWVVNVGDIKPAEIGTEFFLRLAWDPADFKKFDQSSYLSAWASRTFGPEHAGEIGDILNRYYHLNVIKPEYLNLEASGFDHLGHGDEASCRLDAFAAVMADADRIAPAIPADLRDAYFQLVLYPVRGAALMNEKVLLGERSRIYAAQHRASTNATAAASRAAFDRIQTETAFYNDQVAGGKWRHFMSANPRNTPVFQMPNPGAYAPPAAAGLGLALEGAGEALAPFSHLTPRSRFIDIFNTGKTHFAWTARSDARWITLTRTTGEAGPDARIWISIDWSRVPAGPEARGQIVIEGAGQSKSIPVIALNPPVIAGARFIEDDGAIEFGAGAFSRSRKTPAGAWQPIPHLGQSGDAVVATAPTNTPPLDPATLRAAAPSLEYDLGLLHRGAISVRAFCLPTHRLNADHRLRYAVAIDDETPQIVDLETEEFSPQWAANVLRAAAIGKSRHRVDAPGRHVLKVWMLDPGVVLDHFEIDREASAHIPLSSRPPAR